MGSMSEVRLEPLVGREHLVRELFWSTLTIGEPLKFELNCAEQYENLSLEWYLNSGSADCAIAMIGDKPVGYCLVCTDHESIGSETITRLRFHIADFSHECEIAPLLLVSLKRFVHDHAHTQRSAARCDDACSPERASFASRWLSVVETSQSRRLGLQ
jgi:hypothetical protein